MIMSCFLGGGNAFLSKSVSTHMQQIEMRKLSMSSVDQTVNGATLLDPKVVSSNVFGSDQRPIILFDGGTYDLFLFILAAPGCF